MYIMLNFYYVIGDIAFLINKILTFFLVLVRLKKPYLKEHQNG